MALVRILVDGYSLLHQWPELALGRPRHSAAAREALVRVLTQYCDASHTPITVFFDGAGKGPPVAAAQAATDVEVLFSKSGQTADDLIERAAHRFQPYGEVMVVTDDFAERDTVMAFGGVISSCANFIALIQAAQQDLVETLQHYNRKQQQLYRTKQ